MLNSPCNGVFLISARIALIGRSDLVFFADISNLLPMLGRHLQEILNANFSCVAHKLLFADRLS